MIAEHTDDAVADVDGKTGKHTAHLGLERRERIEYKCVRRLLFRFDGTSYAQIVCRGSIRLVQRRAGCARLCAAVRDASMLIA